MPHCITLFLVLAVLVSIAFRASFIKHVLIVEAIQPSKIIPYLKSINGPRLVDGSPHKIIYVLGFLKYDFKRRCGADSLWRL